MTFGEAVAKAQESLGTFDKQHLAREVRALVDDDEYQSRTWSGWVGACLREARQEGSDGLPRCASVDNKGTYVQQQLWTTGDFSVITKRYVDQGAASLTKAERTAAVCRERFGVDIDVEAMWKARRPA